MTVVIPTGARVIDIDLDTSETNVFKNVPYETHEQFYSTDIGMAFLKFTGLEQDYTGCTARLTLINFNDGSKVQRIFEMDTTTTFVYPMLETELVHAGRWIGQLAVIKGGTTISDNPFRFKINGPIMNTALISFDNVNTFTDQLTTIYDGLNAFLDNVILEESDRVDAEGLRVVAEGLRVTAEELRETAETRRQTTFEANEITRTGIVNSLITAQTIAQMVAEKYQLIEATQANRLLTVEQQLEHKVGGLVSVLDYGADPTGVADSTAAFNNAISYLRTTIISSNFQIGGEILIPAGVYKITGKVTISPFVHLKTQGFVHIKSTVASGSTFHFTAQAGDPTFLTLMSKQQYLRSPFINAKDGGMLISSTLGLSQVGTIGLEIGSQSDLGYAKPTSRFAICDVAIDNFDIGMQLNIFNNYIGRFENIHIEENNTSVKLGTTTTRIVDNSGENFNFYSCIFAGGTTGFDWFADGMNCNFYGCSFDFIDTVFKTRQNWKQVTVNGGHIEGAITIIDTSLATASIDLTNPSTFYLDAPVIFCQGSAYKGSPLFKGKMILQCNNPRWTRTVSTIDSFLYASDDTALIVKEVGHAIQGSADLALSPNLNCLRNSKFQLSDLTLGDAGAPFSGYVMDKGSAIDPVVTATIPSGSPYTRALKVGATADTGFWTHLVTEAYNVKPGDVLQLGAVAYLNVDGTTKTITQYASFYDAVGTLILNTTAYSYTAGSTDPTKWYTFFGAKFIVAPAGAKTVKTHCTISGLKTGEIAYLGELFLGIS